MADNRSDDYRRIDRMQDDMIDRANNNSEKNVTEMNTEISTEEKQINPTTDFEQNQDMDALLDELLGEIAREDQKIIAPLEAQAAWRKAVRAEAAAQSESAQRKNAKIISFSRWMRSAGSIAAALAVLFVGTYSMQMDRNADKNLSADSETAPIYDSYREQNENSYDDFRGGMVISAGGYTLTPAQLKSDGKDDQSTSHEQVKLTSNMTESDDQARAEQETADGAIAAPIVVRSAERSIQSMNYERDMQWMSDLVSEYDAYYEEKTETAAVEPQSGRVSRLFIRVPAERLDDFLMEMDQLGVTVMRSEKAEEITGRYMDTQSRLSAMYLQKDKLSGMIESAHGVQEIIAIEAQLAEVISEIERLEGDMRRWQSQQNYCAVKVTLTEVFEQPLAAEASMSERMKAGFDESVVWLGEFGRDALVLLVSFLPRLVIWIPAAVLLGIIIGALVRRKNG